MSWFRPIIWSQLTTNSETTLTKSPSRNTTYHPAINSTSRPFPVWFLIKTHHWFQDGLNSLFDNQWPVIKQPLCLTQWTLEPPEGGDAFAYWNLVASKCSVGHLPRPGMDGVCFHESTIWYIHSTVGDKNRESLKIFAFCNMQSSIYHIDCI